LSDPTFDLGIDSIGLQPDRNILAAAIAPEPAISAIAFGHAHHGFTLEPPTRRLQGEAMTSMPAFCDPKPFAADRF
jgi:hypothetical protein